MDRGGIALVRADVIAGAVDVTCVDAEADAAGEVAQAADGGQLLKCASEDGACPGCCLEQDHRAIGAAVPEDVVETPGCYLHALLGPLSAMCSGMDDEIRDAQPLGPADVADHAVPRLPEEFGVARCQVDQVGRVHRAGDEMCFLHATPECQDLVARQRRCLPLQLALGEDLEGVTRACSGVLRSVRHPSCDRDVCPQNHWAVSPLCSRTRKNVCLPYCSTTKRGSARRASSTGSGSTPESARSLRT